MNTIPELQPGDCLIYWRNTFLDWVIAIKTWTFAGHVEGYRGEGMSVASRNGLGVNLYPLRTKGLRMIRRPNTTFGRFNLTAANSWFFSVQGQSYDWIGLLCFTLAVKKGSASKMFCSEFLARWYRSGGFPAIADDYDADRVAPAQFAQTPALETIWRID